MKNAMNTAEQTVNVVRLVKGSHFVRFENTKECPNVVTRHDSFGHTNIITLDEAQDEQRRIMGKGWRVSAA